MSDAPKRLWAQDAEPSECNFIGGGWWDDSIGNTQYPDIVEYHRADLSADLVRAMALSNTGAKIGTKDMWADRIASVHDGGIERLADATMERWFSKAFLGTPDLELWRNMLTRQPDAGYAGCNEAAARIEELEAQLAKAMAGLEESQREIDQYIQFEYPSDHPVHERYRNRDFSANPARLALAEIKGA